MNVLVVDDDEAIRELVVELLNGEGYAVDSAASVAEGLTKLEQSIPDVVLVDVGLGDSDGRTLIDRCRSDRRFAPLPIILMTAASWDDAHNEISVTAVVSKPFEIDDLLEAVRIAATVRSTPDSSGLPS